MDCKKGFEGRSNDEEQYLKKKGIMVLAGDLSI